MASFTDNVPQLTNFKEYVPQQPIEAMVNVGRTKQAQYDQGVEKLQNQIENIAGLDVIRDVDKQYLQSKLNSLGKNLSLVAAGDFSNYQLVNSVGGMINKIGKDTTIQTAVGNTMKYRKGLNEMDQAKKDGKSSPSNEWAFQNDAQQWLNNPDPNASFTGTYQPYTNYKKNALEVIKSLTKDETITDDAFTTDSKGNLVIADANVRRKLAGISPDKIQQALMATLSPGDFKQMEIDGRYNYSNVDPRRFAQDLSNSYTEKVSFYSQQKKVLENAKSSTTSNIEKVKLNDQIASLDKVIRNINREQAGMAQMISSGNIEGVKAQLHTSNFIDNFSKAFSYTETSQTYQNSPFAEMAMQRANKEQDWKKFMISHNWDKTKFALEYEQKERSASEKKKAEEGYGPVAFGVPQDELPQLSFEKVKDQTFAQQETLDSLDSDFYKDKGKDWFEAQKSAWEERPGSVPAAVRQYFSNTAELRRRTEGNKSLLLDLTKEADQKFGVIEDYIPEDATITTYTTPEGQEVVYTPEDFVTYNQIKDKYVINQASGGTGGASSRVMFDMKKAKEELSPKQYHLLEIQSGKVSSRFSEGLLLQAQKFNKEVNAPYRKVLEEREKFIQQSLQDKIAVKQGVLIEIPTLNKEQSRSVGNMLSRFTDFAKSQKGKIAGSEDFDADVASKLAIDDNTQYKIRVVGGSEFQEPLYEVIASGKEGEVKFKLTEDQKNLAFKNQFDAPREVKKFDAYYENQLVKKGGATTYDGKGDPAHDEAYLNPVDFPRVSNFGIKGDIEKLKFGGYALKVHIFDPVTKQWYDNIEVGRGTPMDKAQVVKMLEGLDDSSLFQLIHEKPPTNEDLIIIKEAAKKPL
jgi:hypothetical protein